MTPVVVPAMPPDEMCPCGRPLHYDHFRTRALVDKQIALHGPAVKVTVRAGTWLVPRHYIALHGLNAKDVQRIAEAYQWPRVGGPYDGHHDQ